VIDILAFMTFAHIMPVNMLHHMAKDMQLRLLISCFKMETLTWLIWVGPKKQSFLLAEGRREVRDLQSVRWTRLAGCWLEDRGGHMESVRRK